MINVRAEFEKAWPLLKPAIIHDTHRKRHIWDAIDKGLAQLWTLDGAALVTEIKVYPTGLRAMNLWLAGGVLAGVQALVVRAEAEAKSRRCALMTISFCRPGWERALNGYSKAGIQLTKEI